MSAAAEPVPAPAADPAATRAATLTRALLFVATVVALVSSLGAPLIPTIAEVDGVSVSTAQWSLTVTMLVAAVATPVLGRLADGARRKTVIVAALSLVLLGCVLAALPAGFPWLLAGRALQGCGVGLGALAMGVARDELEGERSRTAIAGLSVTTVAGVGLGYPMTGLLADRFGLHAAFWAGAVVTAGALAVAVLVLPADRAKVSGRVDWFGALSLAGTLVALLLAISNGERWGWASGPTLLLAVVAAGLGAGFVRFELRHSAPLVELRLLGNRSVLAAHLTSLIAGVGIYLLLSLVIRYVQTPPDHGYGFGASTLLSGLILVPFSLAGLVANRLLRSLPRRVSPDAVLPAGALVFVAALAFLATSRSQLWEIFAVMAVAGLGAGCTFAAMPALVVAAVPADQTASSMALNQVLRTIGFAIGSAASAVVLDAYTAPGEALPSDAGYTAGAVAGGATWLAAAVVCLVVARGRRTVRAVHAGDPVEEGVVPAASGVS